MNSFALANHAATATLPAPAASYPTYAPAECPFETVIIDVTHRCNMGCRNCYIPNRTIPDLDAGWLMGIVAELPRGTFVRLVGAEPTMREDLPDLIRGIRAAGHHPVMLTNGLKLADRAYVRELRRAGLQVAYLSLNGVFDDDLYEAVDAMRCAERKAQAFANLRAEHLFTSLGMIVVRDVNEHAVADLWRAAQEARNVRELHLRSVGAIGRYLKRAPLSLAELLTIFSRAAGVPESAIDPRERTATSHDFLCGRLRVQLTQWPDLGSSTRGRLTPEGRIAPFFEHVLDNEGGY
ncbi:MAG: radical SAM protein [Blastocatellia bacterium]|nr:radical SAM protein [Blastocatellia bacterium]